MKFFSISFIFSFWFVGCTQIQRTADAILQPTAREVYVREIENEEILKKWISTFENAKNDSLLITVPYVEEGKFHVQNHFAYSYDVLLEKGQKLKININKPVDSVEVFVDVFKKDNSGLNQLKSSETKVSSISMEVEESGLYKIIIQPEISAGSSFTFLIYTEASYQFPVSGATNQNIQSYWGADRDGGSRTHEGVDIFAKRGTPVVAGTDGRIGFTGERGLGGKQVWVSDGLFGNSLYYAHLDSIWVASGDKVEKGDTLGTVGNTGNAKNSPPHLHFGIYQSYGGAINPLPFIKIRQIPKSGSGFESISANVTKDGAELRKGPSVNDEQIAVLSKNDSVFILGRSGKWYHVSTENSLKGFMHQSLLKNFN